MRTRIFISVFLLLLLIGCTVKTPKGEIWVEVESSFNGEVVVLEEENSYLKYLTDELVFIERKNKDNKFKLSSVYYVKKGDYYYYSRNKLVGNQNIDTYEGKIKIEKTENKLVIICEANNYIKSYKKVKDQNIIDKFN